MITSFGERLAYCGLNCQTCPVYQATRVEDRAEQDRMRTEIARICREEYGLIYDLKDINDCDGCWTEYGNLFSGCRNCKIRNCARDREYENCAFCPEYPCIEFYVKDPSAKANLDRIRNILQ
jgi:hypothetical protein